MPAPARGRVIAQVGRLVEANKEALARLVTREIGKPYAEALGEVQEIVDTCDFFLGEGRRLYGQTVPSEMPDKQLFTFRMPVGVAAIITAGNFPVAVPSWYLVPAILCGNAVVWKPAEYARRAGRRAGAAVPRGRRARRRAEPRAGRRAPTRSRAWSAALEERPGRQGRLHRLERGRLEDRRAVRPPPAVALPGARRQEPDGGDGRRRPRPRGRGRAVRRLRHGGPALHVAGHGDRARVGPRRVRAPSSTAAVARRRSATRRGRALRADDPRALRRALRGLARADPRPPHGRTARPRAGRITRRQPARGLRRRPGRPGIFYHPTIVDGRDGRRRDLLRPRRSARSSAWRSFSTFDEAIELANGHGYGLSSAIYTTLGDARVPVPRADHAPAWSRSTTRPPAPRRTCRSAATAGPATARASRASGCSTSSPAGSR